MAEGSTQHKKVRLVFPLLKTFHPFLIAIRLFDPYIVDGNQKVGEHLFAPAGSRIDITPTNRHSYSVVLKHQNGSKYVLHGVNFYAADDLISRRSYFYTDVTLYVASIPYYKSIEARWKDQHGDSLLAFRSEISERNVKILEDQSFR